MRIDLLKGSQEPTQVLETYVRTKDPSGPYFFPAALSGIFIALLLTVLLQNPFAAAFFGLTLFHIIMTFADEKIRKEMDILDDQIEVFLVGLGALAGKMPFLSVIKAVLSNTPDPLQSIVRDMVRKYEMGIPIEIDSRNKDLKMLVELIRLKELYGGDITPSLIRLGQKAKSTRDLRAEIKTGLVGSQVALISQYGLMTAIMVFTLRQSFFQEIMIHSIGGKAVMTIVALIFLGSAYYSRKTVSYD